MQMSSNSFNLDQLKQDLSCNECNTFQLTLRRLNNCPHLLCESCFMKNETCTICEKKQNSINLQEKDDVTGVLSHLNVLWDINKSVQNVEDSKITFLFASKIFNYKRHHNGETQLHKECRSGNLKEVERLISSGMDINVQDYAGWTPLHEAVLNQRLQIVKLLLANGALVNVPGLDYLTPLHSAVLEKNSEIVEALLKSGANCMTYNKDGKTPLDLCEDPNIKNLICLTQPLGSIIRVYTVPELKVFFHNVDKNIIQQLSAKSNITIMTKNHLFRTGDVKYFVVGDNNPDIKYLQAAILQGACVVTLDLVNDLMLKDVTINPMNYFADFPNYAISKAGLNELNKLPKLFDGFRFYFVNYTQQKINGLTYSLNDVKELIILGGGVVDSRSPSGSNVRQYYPYHANKTSKFASTNYYLLCDESKKGFRKKTYPKEFQYQTVQWLLDCINSFTISP